MRLGSNRNAPVNLVQLAVTSVMKRTRRTSSSVHQRTHRPCFAVVVVVAAATLHVSCCALSLSSFSSTVASRSSLTSIESPPSLDSRLQQAVAQQRQANNNNNMFLDNPSAPSSKLQSPSSWLLSSTSSKSSSYGGSSHPDERRPLGFDVFYSHNLNSRKWNLPETITSSVAPSSPPQVAPVWFPWIPTRKQLESLKVTELKALCGQRGLKKSGNKADLQDRLWEWSQEQQQKQRQAMSTQQSRLQIAIPGKAKSSKQGSENADSLKANSLAEWARTVNLEPLLQRRGKIHHERHHGKQPLGIVNDEDEDDEDDLISAGASDYSPRSEDYLSKLAQILQKTAPYSNKQVQQMYAAAKHADKVGDHVVAKELLQTLLHATPHDARIYRRLARMYAQEGERSKARAVLQSGIRKMPNNAYLWHGLGQLELNNGNGTTKQKQRARSYFQKAIACDSQFAFSYHALGTLEHGEGRIANAMKVLKRGVRQCPTNHRLHHALGDLYREAKMLDMATLSYQRALKHGPPVSHCFANTALAYIAYEQEDMDKCRYWLCKAVEMNDGRHAQGWVALSKLEESEGDWDLARKICVVALTQYERTLLERSKRSSGIFRRKGSETGREASSFGNKDGPVKPANTSPTDSVLDYKDELLLKAVPRYRSGDRFLQVYKNWIRLEQKYGSVDTVDEVYRRASIAFPGDWKLHLEWAQYHAGLKHRERARAHFAEACSKAANRHGNPYRQYAEYEMSIGNYEEARLILFQGAQQVAGVTGNTEDGLAGLFYVWAVCEWHLENFDRSGYLFDHALRLTDNTGDDDEGSKLRSLILYAMARLEHARGELHLSQHCIGLCLKENTLPGGNARVWDLWEEVALEMDDEGLARQCRKQADSASQGDNGGKNQNDASTLVRLLGSRKSGESNYVRSESGDVDVKQLMRREPWHHIIFPTTKTTSNLPSRVWLPSEPTGRTERVVQPLLE